jgi:hypothetical protein
MTTPNPITPPPKLVGDWLTEAADLHLLTPANLNYLATRAAQWGADQELEACCEYLVRCAQWEPEDVTELRAARRPKPPSLKEQALEAWEIANETWCTTREKEAAIIIRRAIEALPDD